MKKNPELHTTGGLRQMLIQLMLDVRNDLVPLEKAAVLVKVAGRINESLHVETRARAVDLMAGERLTDYGRMLIGDIPEGPALLSAPLETETAG